MDQFVSPVARRAGRFACVGLLAWLAMLSGGCPLGGSNACIDAVQVADDDIAIKLINESGTPVHLIGSHETHDPCNRVDSLGGHRFIWVRGDRISYTVRAYSDDILLDEVTCSLPEEQNVRYDSALRCTAG